MSDLQWLWCYFNILEDEKEDELKWKSRLDYLGWWVNPQLAKSVMEVEKKKDNKNKNNSNNDEYNETDPSQEVVEGDTAVNSAFEDELRNALAEAGIEEEFTELPDSQNVGDENESKDDFITRVMAAQQMFDIPDDAVIFDQSEKSIEQTVQELGLDMDDIDFFEFPD